MADEKTPMDCAIDQHFKSRLLFGEKGMEALRASRVMVVGVGGVGGSCVVALARAGVGHLVLVDPDDVSVTNINRQAVAFHSTVGRPKVEVARAMVRDINPAATVETVRERIAPEGVEALLADAPDFVVDAQDTVSTKIAIAQHCAERGIPLISSMGTGNKLHPELFQIDDISKTAVCPLCKVVRKELRARGVEGVTVLYSREEPRKALPVSEAPEGEKVTVGTASFVPPVAGMMLAGHVVRSISGME